MNRRDFIKTMTAAAACVTPAVALAQTPAEIIQRTRQKMTEAMAHASEFDFILEEDIEWIDGFSNGKSCTFEAPPQTPMGHSHF